MNQPDLRAEAAYAEAMQRKAEPMAADEFSDRPKAWDQMTPLEKRVERWREAQGLSHWCRDE
jgi:hypothetical protein